MAAFRTVGATLRKSKISEPKAALDSILSGGLRAFPCCPFSAFKFSIGNILWGPQLKEAAASNHSRSESERRKERRLSAACQQSFL